MLTSGDVVELDLGAPTGREAGFVHPGVVVTAQRVLDASPSVIQIVPVTSRLRDFASEIQIVADPSNGFTTTSSVQSQHIRAISTRRLGETRGNVGPVALAQIRESIGLILDLPV